MPFQPRILKTQEIAWTAGELQSQPLPKVVYRGLQLRLRVVHTNSSASGLTIDNLLNLVPRLNLVVDGQDNRMTVSLRDLYYMNRFDYSLAPPSTIVTGDGAGKISWVDLYLPMVLTRAAVPQDTLFDARNVTSVHLEATWGSASSIATSGATVTSASLQINTDEYTNVPAELLAGRHELNAIDYNLDRVGEIRIELPRGSNHQYRRLFLFTRNSGVLSNVQLDNISVKSRSFDYVDVQADRLQAWNQRESSIAPNTGVYVVNFIRDGQVTQRIDARNLPELVLTVNSLVSDGALRVFMDKAIFL